MAVYIKNLSKTPIFLNYEGVCCRFLKFNESTSGIPESLINEDIRMLAAQKLIEFREVEEPVRQTVRKPFRRSRRRKKAG